MEVMADIIVKKNKQKVNDGGHNAFGVDVDPNKTLKHCTNPDGSSDTYHKEQKISYDDYVSELESRYHKNTQGKNLGSSGIGLFSGFGKGTLNKNK